MKTALKNTGEFFTVFAIGGTLYSLCELVFRGYTHWTMTLLGGICFLSFYLGEKKYSSLPLHIRCFTGGVFITSLELIVGSVVNTLLKMSVWDYSNIPLNLFGQVCLPFFFLWVLVCIPAFYLCSTLSVQFGKKSSCRFRFIHK